MQTDAGLALEKSTMVIVTLCAGSLNALIAAIAIPHPLINQLAAMALPIYLLLGALVWGLGAVVFASHAMIVCTFCILATLISQTGGINSPAVVWMPIVSIGALLLVNLRWSIVWMGLIVAHNLIQFIAAQQHWIHGQVDASVITEVSAFWVRVYVLIVIMLALALYEATFRRAQQKLALRNADLESLQTAQRHAQQHIDALIFSLGQHLRAPVQKVATLQRELQLSATHGLGAASQQIQGVAQHTVELVNQVLDIAQYETNRLMLRSAPFCVQDAIFEAVRMPAAMDTERAAVPLAPIEVRAQAPLWVIGDGARFTQVLRYALKQALRLAAGGMMHVSADMQGTVLHVHVQFVASSTSDSTSQIFTQAPDGRDPVSVYGSHAQDWEHAQCERLLALAGATLSKVTDGDLTGCMDLYWPATVCDAPPEDTQSQVAPENKAWRFLLVDDQPKRLAELQSMVRRHWPGAVLGQSDSGESALLQLEFAHYDLVLMALHMQAVDGPETVRRMRQHNKPEVREMPVIALCDKAFAHQRQRYLAAGIQWLLFRPLEEEQLARLVQLHLPEEVM